MTEILYRNKKMTKCLNFCACSLEHVFLDCRCIQEAAVSKGMFALNETGGMLSNGFVNMLVKSNT